MKKGYSLLLVGLIVTSLYIVKPQRTQSIEQFFTLVYLTVGAGPRTDYGNLLREQLARIGINLDIIILSWADYVSMGYIPDFDISYVSLTGGSFDPDFTGVYNENGSLNLFGYHTSMDWDEELGTGKNEWYMREGLQMLPPNSQERIQHYWE